MNGFLDELGRELRVLAETPVIGVDQTVRPSTARTSATRPRRTALTLALTGAVVVALGTLPWVAERTQRVSPLDAPVANAAAYAGRPGVPPASGYDLARSRPFPTPDGSGFVVTAKDGHRRCLVLPDRLAPNTFGSSCALATRAKREGILAAMVQARTADRPGRTLAALLLPRGATDVRVTSQGATIPFTAAGGVAVVVATDRATISLRVRGRRISRQVAAPFLDLDRTAIRCPDGRLAEVTKSPPTERGGPPQPIVSSKACD